MKKMEILDKNQTKQSIHNEHTYKLLINWKRFDKSWKSLVKDYKRPFYT